MEHKPNIYHSGLLFISRCDALLCLWNKQVSAGALNKDDVCLFSIIIML